VDATIDKASPAVKPPTANHDVPHRRNCAAHLSRTRPRRPHRHLAGCVRIVEQARRAVGCLDIAICADLVDPGRVNIFEPKTSNAWLHNRRQGNSQRAHSAQHDQTPYATCRGGVQAPSTTRRLALAQACRPIFEILAIHNARVFVIWTTNPDPLTLRHPNISAVSKPYKQLLFDFHTLMENEAPDRLGSLTFNLRDLWFCAAITAF
jgi:hypothetical protein